MSPPGKREAPLPPTNMIPAARRHDDLFSILRSSASSERRAAADQEAQGNDTGTRTAVASLAGYHQNSSYRGLSTVEIIDNALELMMGSSSSSSIATGANNDLVPGTCFSRTSRSGGGATNYLFGRRQHRDTTSDLNFDDNGDESYVGETDLRRNQ